MASPYKSRVCGRSRAGIAGLNHAGSLDVCHLWLLCLVRLRSVRQLDHSSRGILPIVAYLSVIGKPGQREGPGPLRGVKAVEKNLLVCTWNSMAVG